MALQLDILAEGKKLKGNFNYNSDPIVVRIDGLLNYGDDKMDCSEFILFATKNAGGNLYKMLLDQTLPAGKEGGNTKTIQSAIKKITALGDLHKLPQDNPAPGDWILWNDHIEMIEEVSADGRYITLGANGAAGDKVPKNINSRNFDSVKKIATKFLGIWTPSTSSDTVVAALTTRVEKLESFISGFSPVFAAKEMKLNAAFDLPDPVADLRTPVHLRFDNTNATLTATPPQGQAFPLFEGDSMPFNTSDEANLKITHITTIINFLKVDDDSHERYVADGANTFCNIYVYDCCYLMGFDINKYYVPRVWWTDDALDNINNGIPQIPAYGTTLREMLANDLYSWFDMFGSNFGRLKQNDLNALQEAVNSTGDPGIIVGKKPGGHGHITLIVPEQSADPAGVFSAMRNADGLVINPLQSQAGASNFEYGNLIIGGQPWFTTGGHIAAFYVFNQI